MMRILSDPEPDPISSSGFNNLFKGTVSRKFAILLLVSLES
jgi:hypothetical protein